MTATKQPRPGTKTAIMNELFRQKGGASLQEINKATGWTAFSYIRDVTRIAKTYGGTPRSKGVGQTRRFWIE